MGEGQAYLSKYSKQNNPHQEQNRISRKQPREAGHKLWDHIDQRHDGGNDAYCYCVSLEIVSNLFRPQGGTSPIPPPATLASSRRSSWATHEEARRQKRKRRAGELEARERER